MRAKRAKICNFYVKFDTKVEKKGSLGVDWITKGVIGCRIGVKKGGLLTGTWYPTTYGSAPPPGLFYYPDWLCWQNYFFPLCICVGGHQGAKCVYEGEEIRRKWLIFVFFLLGGKCASRASRLGGKANAPCPINAATAWSCSILRVDMYNVWKKKSPEIFPSLLLFDFDRTTLAMGLIYYTDMPSFSMWILIIWTLS